MPDNITTPALGTALATDEIENVHYPRSKVGFGGEGVYSDVSADAPLPVAIGVLPLPAGAATDGGAGYTQSIVTLTAGQAAGTDALLPANAARKALMFGASVDFKIALTGGAADGLRVYASARDSFVGKECPVGAVYLVPGSGLAAGAALVVWEA